MAKPKSLLKGQELTPDNHHPNTPLEWDASLHLHKKVTVGNKGKKVGVSGSLYVASNREIGVAYDKGGNNHGHIRNKKEENDLREKFKKEVREALTDSEEATAFIKNIREHVDCLSQGKDNPLVARDRMVEAFDNIMDAFGVSTNQKKIIRNSNNELFLLYVDTPKLMDYVGYLAYVVTRYNRYYHLQELFEPGVYYVTFIDGQLSVGEFSPYAALKYRMKGFSISGRGMYEGL